MKRFTKPKVEVLHSLLKTVCKKIEYINYGGCGIFAYYLSGLLAENGYRSEIICLDRPCSESARKHRSNLCSIAKRDKTASFIYTHLCLKIGNYFIDCEAYEKIRKENVFNEGYRALGKISRNDLKFLISLEDRWNRPYDRSQNSRLKRLLRSVVNKLP